MAVVLECWRSRGLGLHLICRLFFIKFKYRDRYYCLVPVIQRALVRRRQMNGRAYSVRVEGAKYGASFGSALAIEISYTTNHSILWAIIHGILSWLYVAYFALFRA